MEKFYTRFDKRFNIHASATIDGVTYPNFENADLRETLGGFVERDIPTPPDNFDPSFCDRKEYDDSPWYEYVWKTDDEQKRIWNERIDQQIAVLEGNNPIGRATREFMLASFLMTAQTQGITQAQLLDPVDPHYAPGFAKVYALDQQIADLRRQRK